MRPALSIHRREATALCEMDVSNFNRADIAALIPAASQVGGCKVRSLK